MTILANTNIRNTLIALTLDVATGDIKMFIIGVIITAIASCLIVNFAAQEHDQQKCKRFCGSIMR